MGIECPDALHNKLQRPISSLQIVHTLRNTSILHACSSIAFAPTNPTHTSTMASSQPSTPALSRSSSRSSTKSARKTPPLRLDLSDLPPLITPSPPSNTLLITNLQEPELFHIPNLTPLRYIINQTATIHTWAPLKSFRRIVVSFFDTNSAISIKQQM